MQETDTGFQVIVHAADESTTLAGTFAGRYEADALMQRLLAEGKVVSIVQSGTTVVERRGTSTT